MDDSSQTQETSSGQPGVPTGDQRPTNERENIVADVNIPGPYPTGSGEPTDESASSSRPEPTKEDRDADSLGDVVHGSGTPVVGDEAASAGAPAYQHDPDSPEGKVERARAESFPDGVPEDADVGSGRRKGQGLPPGSVGKGADTPQTPAT